MIEVEIHFIRFVDKRYAKSNAKESYVYPKFIVKGHANDGSMTSIKVCACITGILSVIPQMTSGLVDSVLLNKGYFKYEINRKITTETKCLLDEDVQWALNTCVWVLYSLYNEYPSLFKSFEIIEEREVLNDGRNKANKK